MIYSKYFNGSRWLTLFFVLLSVVTGIAIGLLIPFADGALKAIVLTFGAVIAILTFFKVDIGLYALILMAYLRISDIAIDYYGAPSVFKPFIALLIITIIVQWLRNKEIQKGWGRAILLVLTYGLVIFTSLLYASDYTIAANAVSDFAKNGVITILLVILIQSPSQFRGAMWVLIAAGIFTGTISVFQYLSNTFTNAYWGFGQAEIQNIVTGVEDYRISGPIGDPNFYAQILVIIVPLAFHFLLSEKKLILRGLAAWCLAVCSLSIVFTFSRGGAIALGIVLICIIVYRRPKPLELFLIGLLIVCMLIFMPEKYSERLTSVFEIASGQTDVREEVSVRGRLSELLVAWQMFLDHPILGVGVGNYPNHYQSYSRQIGLDPRTENREPHNLFLEVASETGIVGLVVFFSILYFAFKSINQARQSFKFLSQKYYSDLITMFGIGLIGYLSAAMFIHGAYPRYFWLLMGVSFSLPQIVKHAVHQQENCGE